MNIEEVRDFALSLKGVVEVLFAEDMWVSFRVEGKWFMLLQLNAPEPRVAVKLPPDLGNSLREKYDGVRPAYHMNKVHWNDLYLNLLSDNLVEECINHSYSLVIEGLSKKIKAKYMSK